ncbi:MAG: hypothetical protein A2Z83_04820 [Omnitrophica bacterium GWA2_52_8]|nr:MAG: hypothetical protein A2Z83_04820 [Omnitrophica bacterium GWA2_52_8]
MEKIISPLYIRQLEIGPMQNFVYLIGDRNEKKCVMVDPAWDVSAVLKAAEEDGMEVTGGLVTHTHFDHCNGAEELLKKIKGKLYIHKAEADRLKGMGGDLVKSEAGTKINIGDVQITFIHTPGHTPGSQCFLVSCGKAPSDSGNLVSGDTLFINACGRCDLPGGNAAELYESLQALAKLDEKTLLFPGHNYAEEAVSSIGKEKIYNPYLQYRSLNDFLGFRMG